MSTDRSGATTLRIQTHETVEAVLNLSVEVTVSRINGATVNSPKGCWTDGRKPTHPPFCLAYSTATSMRRA